MQPTLYHQPYCSYCQRVVRVIHRLNLDVNFIDLNQHPDAGELLLRERGRATVPVLGIPTPDGETLLGESLDIIAWLETHASSLKKAS